MTVLAITRVQSTDSVWSQPLVLLNLQCSMVKSMPTKSRKDLVSLRRKKNFTSNSSQISSTQRSRSTMMKKKRRSLSTAVATMDATKSFRSLGTCWTTCECTKASSPSNVSGAARSSHRKGTSRSMSDSMRTLMSKTARDTHADFVARDIQNATILR